MRLLPDFLKIKRPLPAPDLIVQRPDAGMIDPPGLQCEPVSRFNDFKPVARANPQSVQHPYRQGDLAF